MLGISEKKLYTIISYLFGLFMILVFGSIFLLINFLRIKFVSFFGINMVVIWISYIFYVPLIFIITFSSDFYKKYKDKFKGLIFSSFFLSELNQEVKKPNIDEYGITENELKEYAKRNRIDTKFYSGILAMSIIVYLMFSSLNSIKDFEFLKLSVCLIMIFILKKIIDRKQLHRDRKWTKYDSLNQYIKDLESYHNRKGYTKSDGTNN